MTTTAMINKAAPPPKLRSEGVGLGRNKKRGLWAPVPYLAWPAVILIAGTMTWAIGNVLWTSFQSLSGYGGEASYVGTANYVHLFSDSKFLSALGRSVAFTLSSVTGQLILAFLLAILTWSDSWSVRLGRSLLVVPWAVSPVVVAIIWRFIYLPSSSPISGVLSFLGFDDGLLASTKFALAGIVIVTIWQFTPLYFLFILAGLRSIDAGILEAARVDGAGRTRIIFSIVLPQMRGLIVTLAIFDVLSTMGLFDLIWAMTRGGPAGATETLSVFVYQTSFQSYDLGLGAAAVAVIAVVAAILVGLVSTLRGPAIQ